MQDKPNLMILIEEGPPLSWDRTESIEGSSSEWVLSNQIDKTDKGYCWKQDEKYENVPSFVANFDENGDWVDGKVFIQGCSNKETLDMDEDYITTQLEIGRSENNIMLLVQPRG